MFIYISGSFPNEGSVHIVYHPNKWCQESPLMGPPCNCRLNAALRVYMIRIYFLVKCTKSQDSRLLLRKLRTQVCHFNDTPFCCTPKGWLCFTKVLNRMGHVWSRSVIDRHRRIWGAQKTKPAASRTKRWLGIGENDQQNVKSDYCNIGIIILPT